MAPIMFVNKDKEKQIVWWEGDTQLDNLRIFKIGLIF